MVVIGLEGSVVARVVGVLLVFVFEALQGCWVMVVCNVGGGWWCLWWWWWCVPIAVVVLCGDGGGGVCRSALAMCWWWWAGDGGGWGAAAAADGEGAGDVWCKPHDRSVNS